jgi:hypothetical protein
MKNNHAQAVTTATLRSLLRRKYPPGQFALLYEVRDAAGFGASRSADAVSIGLWPSRGCLIEGMELKVSRPDWLRELKRPEKAEAFVPFCDHWWIVAGNEEIVKPDELPKTWGLMTPSGHGLRVVVPAPKLEAKPLDRSLLAAMMKRATESSLETPEVQAEIERRVQVAKTEADSHHDYQTRRLKQQLEELERSVKEFEASSGVTILSWRGKQIGEAVRIVMNGEHEAKLNELRRLKQRVGELHRWLDDRFPELDSSE